MCTKLFFMGKKIKETFFRREVERTALSDSGSEHHITLEIMLLPLKTNSAKFVVWIAEWKCRVMFNNNS